MYKPDLEKAEEPEIKLPAFFWIMEIQKNIYFYFINHTKAFDYVDHSKLWKAPKEMGIPDHLTCLWETCMQVKKQYLESDTEQQTGSKLGRVGQGCILSPCLFNLYTEYVMWNVRLHKVQAEIKIAGKNTNNLKYVDNPTLMVESKEELKSLLIRVKEESEKAGLKLNIQKLRSQHLVPALHSK